MHVPVTRHAVHDRSVTGDIHIRHTHRHTRALCARIGFYTHNVESRVPAEAAAAACSSFRLRRSCAVSMVVSAEIHPASEHTAFCC